ATERRGAGRGAGAALILMFATVGGLLYCLCYTVWHHFNNVSYPSPIAHRRVMLSFLCCAVLCCACCDCSGPVSVFLSIDAFTDASSRSRSLGPVVSLPCRMIGLGCLYGGIFWRHIRSRYAGNGMRCQSAAQVTYHRAFLCPSRIGVQVL